MTVAGLGLSLLASGLASSAGVLVSLRAPTVRQATQTMSVILLLLVFVPILAVQAIRVTVQHQHRRRRTGSEP